MKQKADDQACGQNSQPPSKRMKVITESNSDPLANLPPEIIVDIFLRLRNEDLFLGCSLVSRNWNDFLASNSFWESLIIREFGPEKTKSFLRDDNTLKNFKEDLKTNPLYRFNFFEKHALNASDEKVVSVQSESDEATFEDFIGAISSQDPKFFELADSYDVIRSTGELPFRWLVKLPSHSFKALDILKLPIGYDTLCGGFDQLKIILLDPNLKPLIRNPSDCFVDDLAFFRDYPANVRYIFGSGCYYSTRIVFPSLSKILELSHDLKTAVGKASLPDIESILSLDPTLVNYSHVRSERFSESPLASAVQCKTGNILEQFFDHGASFPPKIVACAIRYSNIESIKLFFEHGLDPNAQGEDGQPLLARLFSNRYFFKKVADLLVAKGADLNYSDADGTTLLMKMANRGFLGVVRYLIDNGAEINRLNAKNQSALQFAFNCQTELFRGPCVEALLEGGANIRVKFVLDDGSESTGLIEAVRAENVHLVKLLLRYGAETMVKDSNGMTAVDYAKQSSLPAKEVLSILQTS